MKSQDDEVEAARELRRRARQERLRNMENEELSSTTTETYSSETSTLITSSAPAEDDDQALLDRIAKREERRQKRMMEALERQKELDPTIMDGSVMTTTEPFHRNGEQEFSQKETETNHWEEREQKKQEEKIKVTKTEVEETTTVKEEPAPVTAAEEPKETPEKIVEDKQESYLKKQESTEEKPKEPAVTNKEESVSANRETKEKTEADLASADLENKEVECLVSSMVTQEKPAIEDKIVEVEIKLEPATSQNEEVKPAAKEEPEKKPEEKPVQKEEPEKLPEEKLMEVKVRIQDSKPPVKEAEKPTKEQEKPNVPEKTVEETPKKSTREVEVKVQITKKGKENPQMKRQAEEKPSTPKKVEEKLVTPKQDIDEKPKWKKVRDETEPKPSENAKLKKKEVMEEKPKPSFLRDKLKVTTKPHDTVDSTTKAKKPEKMLSPTGLRSPETEKQDPIAKLEAERKLQELKRLRNETDSEVLEKMKQKQQTAQAELEELKKKREERKKILEEEEKQKKQQLAEKKAKEEEERKKMKEEIEQRRAEAAEKKKQKEESKVGSKPPFVAPKGASAKIGEKAEFLNKSALKSPVKLLHTPLVCKIGNRLEQYTSAVQTKEVAKSPKSPVDVPVAEGVRNIKSMWEKGNNVNPTSSPASPPAVTKETAVLNIGVAGRINSWKTKTPEQQKPVEPKPTPEPEKPAIKTDQKPADVTKTRGLWETKGSSPAKVLTARSTFVTNGTRK
ncbi:caldesmon 1b isoform X2 [Xyrauchen texanus]|nr:caldesmon 1b isoform X2 [Xyrauchen texanus]